MWNGSESSDGNVANITNSSAKQDGGKHGLEGGTLTSDQQAYLALNLMANHTSSVWP